MERLRTKRRGRRLARDRDCAACRHDARPRCEWARGGQSISVTSETAPATLRAQALHSRRTLAEQSRNWIRYCMSRVRAVQSPPLSIRATGIERRPACPSSALIGDDEVGSAWIGGQARATFGRMTEGETGRQPTQLRRRRHDNRAAAAGQPPSCKRRARRRHARDAPQMRRRADVSGSDLVEART
jgi:hypothetical protein